MPSNPITSSQIDGEKLETVAEFIFLGSKITADGGYSREIKSCLFLGRKPMINLNSVLKQETSLCQQRYIWSKLWFFSVVMYRCESWTIKKTEHWRINDFELWRWRRLLRVTWIPRRSTSWSQRKSILNIHQKDWCWSWSSNSSANWCEELTPWKRPWCWERLKAGGEGDNSGWDGWMTSLTQWTWVWEKYGR